MFALGAGVEGEVTRGVLVALRIFLITSIAVVGDSQCDHVRTRYRGALQEPRSLPLSALPRDSGHAPGITLAYTLQPTKWHETMSSATVRLGRRCPLPGAWRCCELIHGARPFPGQIPAEWGYSHRRSTAAAPAGPSTLARHSRQDQSSPGDGYTHAGCVSVHTPLRVSG